MLVVLINRSIDRCAGLARFLSGRQVAWKQWCYLAAHTTREQEERRFLWRDDNMLSKATSSSKAKKVRMELQCDQMFGSPFATAGFGSEM